MNLSSHTVIHFQLSAQTETGQSDNTENGTDEQCCSGAGFVLEYNASWSGSVGLAVRVYAVGENW